MLNINVKEYAPSLQEISDYVGNSLFDQLCEYLTTEYKALCKIEYSGDSLARGWNVKFRKAGKGLCVIYPKEQYITVLVVVGKKEKEEVEGLLPSLSKEMQEIYQTTQEGNDQRWLMIDLEDMDCLYQDTLQLIRIRRESK